MHLATTATSGSKQRGSHSSPLFALTAHASLGFSADSLTPYRLRGAAEPEGDAINAAGNHQTGFIGAVKHGL